MKAKNSLWALAFACVAVSCSDNLDNGSGDKGIVEENGQKAYITVNISTVSDGIGTMKSTRATDPSNPNGSGAGWGEDGNGSLGELPGKNEGVIHDINIFLVETAKTSLNASDQLENINMEDASNINIAGIVGQGYLSGLNLDASTGGSEDNHGSAEVTVTLKEDLGGVAKNFLVYTIVNAGKQLSFRSLQELREYQQSDVILENENNVSTANKFVMSTHKMISNAQPQNHPSIVTLSSANTKDNPAMTAVYVERLAARIDLAYEETLPNENEQSPTYSQGTFTLTGYMVVNQWQGETNMFKQVTPEITKYTENITTDNTDYGSSAQPRYLGDEVWKINPSAPYGNFNFVWSQMFYEKTSENLEQSEWNTKYTNHFSGTDLNSVSVVGVPREGSLSYQDDDKTFYPVAYVRENTMNTSDQLHGYSTGMIFKTKFSPNDNFKLTEYVEEEGKISGEGTLGTPIPETFYFFTAEHFDGNDTEKVVYKNLKSVAARAFNIADEADAHNLLKGFMEGWDSATEATLQEAQEAIKGMSTVNGLEKAFNEYLAKQLEGVGDFSQKVSGLDKDKKDALTYAQFVESQDEPYKGYFSMDFSNCDKIVIANLAEKYNVYFFKDGESYHKYWIRHDDNNDDQLMGAMEFAIVRNNVYQLSVSGVRGLGDPLPYTPGKDDPGTPDESDEVTIDVTVYVKDWVKRKNDGIIL